MSKVVKIEKRLANKRQKKQLEAYRGKIETLHKVIQCASCHFRCSVCGHQLRDSGSPPDSVFAPFGFAFCEHCKKEFEDFLAISREGRRPHLFWHNKEWVKMWSAWLEYRESMERFMNSPEFKLLLEELDANL